MEDAGKQYKFIFGRTGFRNLVRNSGDPWGQVSNTCVGSEMRNEDGKSDLLVDRHVQL